MLTPGYEVIHELARTQWHILYRGRRLADHLPVLLKVLGPDIGETVSPLAARLLAREFEILRELRLPGVPRAIEWRRDGGVACLALEDLGQPLSTLSGGQPWSLAQFFRIAIDLTAILHDLHRRELIHQGINPGNILIRPESGEVALAGFDFALCGAGETHGLPPLPLPGDSLAWHSPEQTGRMNRTVDYRTDFYSLGAVFYELLTGRPPFCPGDTLELIHHHIARAPAAPAAINPDIPEPLSRIILKLLAKTAEQRYQSAPGLKEDLTLCARAWAEHARIDAFTPGTHDVPDRFMIPQKLYGRENEVARLLAAFDRVCEGGAQPGSRAGLMMLVAGYSGIGKTSLIQELYKPIVRERGYFIAGKFDQVARGVPFGALIQAFRALIRQLLTETEEQLAAWRARLTQALGASGGVVAEVIPEIELIIGPQPPAPPLGPAAALNRFQLVFQKFVGALARADHPLALFLDDLQWADTATLSLLGPLLNSREIAALFILGAYRDNEVDATHPLRRTLDALETAGAELQRVEPGPLNLSDLTQLISDTLRATPADAAPLARLTLEKTGGNPFFVNQFLQTLRRDGFITFDDERRRWVYQLEAIAGAPLTDNVIDLMTQRIRRLPADAQRVLTLAACIGNTFDLDTLAAVSEQAPAAAGAALGAALREGLLVPASHAPPRENIPEKADQTRPHAIPHALTFLHDRVQQAAYELLPAAARQPAHLTIGRLLLASGRTDEKPDEKPDEKLFDVVQHLNLGAVLITDDEERRELAHLNLRAGRRARSATAHAAALELFRAGAALTAATGSGNDMETARALAFSLRFEAAECEYLCGDFDAAMAQFEPLLASAQNPLEKARVQALRMALDENQARYADALTSARAGLALFGVTLPETAGEKQAALEHEIETIQSLLGPRPIASLIDLPDMTSPETRMVMSILTDIWASVYILGDAALARLISAMLVRLSLAHGNTAESAYGYVTHAITVGPVRGDYAAAYEFGLLALRTNEKFHDTRRRARIYQQFHAHVALWRRPFAECVEHAREACRSGLDAGDFLYAAYGAATETWPAMLATPDLARFIHDYTPAVALVRKLQNPGFADSTQIIVNWARALRGETSAPLALSSADFAESAYLAAWGDNPFFSMIHAAMRLQLCYLLGEYAQALAAGRAMGAIVRNLEGMIWTVVHDIWHGLTLAACYATAPDSEKEMCLREIRAAHARLAALATHCPENYLCPSLLLAAELERLAGAEMSAIDLYEQAIDYAAQTKQTQWQALASELYARFWRDRQQSRAAAAFVIKARDLYAQWGATAKVADLERRFPAQLTQRPQPGNKAPATAASEASTLDLDSVMKAARVIAGEMDLQKLPARLLDIVIENAGAERGSLILEHGGEFFAHSADATTTRQPAAHVVPLAAATNLPQGMINYVRRTAESVVLADARDDDRYGADPYITRQQTRSVMCLPVLGQTRMTGILYLEHNAISGVFTPARRQIAQMLAAQAAISLENALLYDETRRTEETLRAIVAGTAAVTGDDFFAQLVRHLAAALRVRYAFATECRGDPKTRARTLAFWNTDRLSDNVEYDITETPCLKVLAGEICHYPQGIQHLFPNDQDLVDMRAEGYLGLPLHDAAGRIIGHLAVLDDSPMPDSARNLGLLKIFAARAGAELERLRTDAELRRAMAEVEDLKNRLHAENIYLQEEIRQEHNFEEIIGGSPALLSVLQEIERVAPTDATVLILGETGTGKELIARAIHNHSPRRQRPLVKVNCGAISAGLVESELFGHVRGAFTGAFEKRTGRFELAHGGTLFLDEAGELPLDTQVRLLRVLQEGEFEPVGSSKTIRVDVRIIAATNRDLAEEVRRGRFRADLYYRLNVLPLHLPALRERAADIPQLALFFMSRFARQFGRRIEGLSRETVELLTRYGWPGNIRELQNIIERGVVLANGPVLSLSPDLFPALAPPAPATAIPLVPDNGGAIQPAPLIPPPAHGAPLSLGESERRHILSVLEQTRWVIEGPQGAALILNLHPNTLRSRMKKLGIRRPPAP
ncbi:MAG: sigma 54-interacting transcriptional regulator [Blastocatellia bacterium]